MTVGALPTIFRYLGNGVTTVFAFNNNLLDKNFVTVKLLTRATGAVVETLLLDTDYSVTFVSNTQSNITIINALKIPSATQDILLSLNIPVTQSRSFPRADILPAASIESGLDKLTLIAQAQTSADALSIKLPDSDIGLTTTVPEVGLRANKYLFFDNSGNAGVASGTGGTAISAPMVPFVQAASLVAAKALLITAGSIATADIANNAVTNAKLATAPAYTVKANNTNATANESDVAIASLYPQNFQIGASVSGNALTITLQPTPITFRSGTGGSGTLTYNQVTAPITLVVPSGATLGTSNGVQSRLAVAALDAGNGITELFVSNITNEFSTTLENITSTIAISASSNVASTAYSTTARTNVPYKVLGVIVSTQATAGTWATAPSFIQGYGVSASSGDALASPLSTVFNVSGSAPLYACRAWVNFNGTGTVAIRASGNVSSITDVGVGNYTVNFANAMPDVNYTVVLGSEYFGGNGTPKFTAINTGRSVNGINFLTGARDAGAFSFQDNSENNCAIFR